MVNTSNSMFFSTALPQVLGLPLPEAQNYLETLGIIPIVTTTFAPKQKEILPSTGEFRVVSYRLDAITPELIVSFFPYGVNQK